MELKDRIKEAMNGAKLSPAQLARDTKSTNAAVSFWLDGQTKSLKAEKAGLMETATGYRAQWIISGKGPKKLVDREPTTNKDPSSTSLAQAVQVLADAAQQLDADSREALLAGLKMVINNPDQIDRAMGIINSATMPPQSKRATENRHTVNGAPLIYLIRVNPGIPQMGGWGKPLMQINKKLRLVAPQKNRCSGVDEFQRERERERERERAFSVPTLLVSPM